MTSIVAADRIFGLEAPGWVAIEGGLISEVGSGPTPSEAQALPGYLVPGFVDLQVNGVDDVAFAEADPAGWTKARRVLLRHGTAAFCPTFVSSNLDSYPRKLDAVESAMRTEADGSVVLGAHLEGPFLGKALGAHREQFIQQADSQWLADLVLSRLGLVTMVTLAPEADPTCVAIRLLSKSGVLVSLGHSTASFEEAEAAADAGARAVTHLFNGMAPFHHREPGLAGAALDDDRLTPTLIADLVHVHPAAIRAAVLRKPNVALISDSVAVNAHEVRELGVSVVDGAPRLPDGTLAGSVLTLDVAIANLAGIGIPLERAVAMASSVPADLLGLQDRGLIEAGRRADLVLLEADTVKVIDVWIGGELVRG